MKGKRIIGYMDQEEILPVVSVIIPVYNIASYLHQCLNSVCNQTLKNIEIICVDDGSQDCSYEIVKEFAKKDLRIKLYQQTHQGVSAARNLGITCSRGDFILFIDGDDWIEENMLECMVQQAKTEMADIVICSAKINSMETSLKEKRRIFSLQKALTVSPGSFVLENSSNIRWKLLKAPGGWPFIWNKLIRRETLKQNELLFVEKLELGEDGLFLQTLYHYVNKIVMISTTFYHYRYLRPDSATVRLQCDDSHRFSIHLKVIEKLISIWKSRGLIEKNEGYLLSWIVDFLYGDFIYLPLGEKRDVAKILSLLLRDSKLSEHVDEIQKWERKRLQNMVGEMQQWGWIKKEKDIFVYKVQEHFRKLIKYRNYAIL